MKSCTIILSHYESVVFLRAAIRQIFKHTDFLDTGHQIIICDQSGDVTHNKVLEEFGSMDYVEVVRTAPLYSGYGLDVLLRRGIETEYIMQLHTDCFPISPAYISLPIALIEEYDLSFVGQLQFISTGRESIYPPSPIFCMAQCYNVAKTETYREMSLEAGFCRFHNRPQSGLTWKNNDWEIWAQEDYSARGSDDDVVAFHWQDKYKTEDKLGLAISGFIQPSFGRIIDDLVFHFGSARESIGVAETMPILYQEYTKRINENYSDELIEEMVALAKANRPPEMEILQRNFWDGTLKVSSPTSEELNKRIEELKR